MNQKPLEPRQALALACEMLSAIAHGERYDAADYYANLYRIQQTLALITLENAYTHLLGQTETRSTSWQVITDTFTTLKEAITAQ
jgi:hypothetical protein